MRPRFPTHDSVFRALAEEKTWRMRELSGLLQAFDRQPENAKYIGRAFIAMLYAHWEGFVKRASTIYLSYIHDRKVPTKKIKDCLLALHIKEKTPELLQTRKISSYCEIVSLVRQSVGITELNTDMTHFTSNLKSEVLMEIVTMLGLSYNDFINHETFIDKDLIELRHRVAHGARIERTLDKETMQEWYKNIMILIDAFKTQIENAVVTDSFLTN